MKVEASSVASQKGKQLQPRRKKNGISAMYARKGKILFLCSIPVIAYVILFGYVPMWGLGYAFVEYRLGKPMLECTFVGLENFKILFENPVIRENVFQSVINTLGMAGINYLLLPLPMLFAILLSELKCAPFKKVVQTVSTLPHFISWVVIFALVNALFSSTGLVNSLLLEWGVIEEPVNVLMSDEGVWVKQVALQKWAELGWSSIIYFSAIAGIDQEQYEAAAIDGAGRWARIRYITIPNLIPTFIVLLIMGVGRILNTGVDQYLIFENAFNKEFITTLDLYVYHLGIGNGMVSYGVATGVLKSVVALTLFYSANYISKKVRGSGIA